MPNPIVDAPTGVGASRVSLDTVSEERSVAVDGLSIHLADHGSGGDPAVLMIHGWPDTGDLWRFQVPVLTGAGYRLLIPDSRGMGRSGRPAGVDGYRVGTCVGDMLAILDDAGVESAHVVAHDWGAAVGWGLAMAAPERVRTLTALSVGHPSSFAAAGLRQLQRSWYMLLFQFEGVAEEWLSADDWSRFRQFTGDHPETERWIANLAGEGALTSSLNWYRANAHPRWLVAPSRPATPCRVPTMGLWSTGDFALTEHQMAGSHEFVEAAWRYERIEGASHWIPLDAPDRLNELLLDWLS